MKYPMYVGQTLPSGLPIPQRVLCVVPSLTETFCDLGLEHVLVGITHYCMYPEGIQQRKTKVGGTKKINIKKAVALSFDWVVANKEENTPEMIEALRAYAPVWVTDIYTIEDALAFIDQLGALFQVTQVAQQWVYNIQQAAQSMVIFTKPRPRVLYLIWAEPYMAAATNTFIHSMLTIAGFDNVMHSSERYPVLHTEADTQPVDWVFCSSEPYTFTEKAIAQVQLRWPNAQVIAVDGTFFSWYGSRLRHAFDYLSALRLQMGQ